MDDRLFAGLCPAFPIPEPALDCEPDLARVCLLAMFTGLVEAMGRIRRLGRGASGAELAVECPWEDLKLGESIAVDGTCLTVEELEPRLLTAQATVETLRRTTLGLRRTGDGVNLERSLALGDRLGGHLVTGHVDAIGEILSIEDIGDDAVRVTLRAPPPLHPFIAEKGSIAVDGVSLTVNGTVPDGFHVALIPHTRKVTTLGARRAGDRVNLEVDVIARYVVRALSLQGWAETSGVTLDLLERSGFPGGGRS